MPIRRLKPSSEEELITHIKNSFADHEEEYVPGAWENFNKKDNKKTGFIYWIGGLSTAAAVLLIGFLFFFNTGDQKVTNAVNHSIAKNAPTVVKPDVKVETTTGLIAPNNQVEQIITTDNNPIKSNSLLQDQEELAVIGEPTPLNTPNTAIAAVVPENTSINEQNQVAALIGDQTNKNQKKPVTIDEFLANENTKNRMDKDPGVKQSPNKRWDLGVVVAPSIGNNEKLNMGYGVSMAYNLSNKVSVGSGLSYNEMGASKDIIGNSAPNSPSANALVSDTKSIQSVNTRVTGIDIPLELRYNLSSRFYANVGVSAFAVINQQQNNVYLQGTVMQRSAVNPAGDLQPQSFLMTEQVSEKAPESLSPNNKLIGFYNFSFGYRQKLSKDKYIGIEPFMKVPMREVTKENLRLLGTGLKIKFDF
jgi:hypothetical protein